MGFSAHEIRHSSSVSARDDGWEPCGASAGLDSHGQPAAWGRTRVPAQDVVPRTDAHLAGAGARRVSWRARLCPPSSAVRRLILVFWRSEIVALQRVAQVKRRSSVVSRIVIEA